MKKITLVSVFFLIPFCIYLLQVLMHENVPAVTGSINHELQKEEHDESERKSDKGLYEEYYKYVGTENRDLTKEQLKLKWNEILSYPSENDNGAAPLNSWVNIGPYGINYSSNRYYTGRVKDIEIEGVPTLRVASASGGMWKFMIAGVTVIPVPISNGMTTQYIGSFATKPGDTNTIVVGTGEPATNLDGNGAWKTTNGGLSWTQKIMNPTPGHFFRLRYSPSNNNVIHAATNTGYYRSNDGGETWVQRFTGNITDIAINPVNPNIVWASKLGDGLYRSLDTGQTFSPVATGIPSSVYIRASISLCQTSPGYVYLNVSNSSGGTTGIFKTTNGGTSWIDVSWRDGMNQVINYHWNQGSYNNCIGVSPTNPDLVLSGGGSLLRTTNGGINWIEDPGVSLHPDQHMIRWHSNGQTVYIGNDGGITLSTDAGITWNTAINTLPVTQFYDFDIAVRNNQIVSAGGTQDNGFPITLNSDVNGSGQWKFNIGRDASGTIIDENDPLKMVAHTWNFSNYFDKTTDGGLTWSGAGTGLNGAIHVSNMEDDRVAPAWCFVGNGQNIFYSENFGDNWHMLNSTPFPSNVWRISVSKYGTGGAVIYAILWSNPPSHNNKLHVYDNGFWYDRGAGLPLAPIHLIGQHPTDNNIAYATIEDYWSTDKIFKTTNRGINWTNVTGNFPNIPVRDVVPHPTNNSVVFAGTRFGMWKTTNSGSTWFRWENEMPLGLDITTLSFIDSSSSNGNFYVAASSYGRGIWVREAAGDDPITGIPNVNNDLPKTFKLGQNYPNPFNPISTIDFSLPANEIVSISIYDVTGREIQKLLNNVHYNAGIHKVQVNGSGLSTGVYFYRISAGKFTEIKKMMLIK